MHIALLNYIYDAEYPTVEALLGRYLSLTGWAESLLAAGAQRVTVLQRFRCNLTVWREGVEYRMCTGRGAGAPSLSDPRRMHQAIAALRPDIAHVNGMLFPAQTWLLRRALPPGSALIVQDHGGPPPRPPTQQRGSRRWVPGWLRSIYMRLWSTGLRSADAFMFTASAQSEPWRKVGLIGPHQPVYEVIEAGRSVRPLPQEQARAAIGLRGEPALLWVGHLDANKDPLTVLEGFERALQWLPQAHLTMVYVGEALLPLIQARLAASPELARRVELRGRAPYETMSALFSAADIFVLGSWREGSGYALIEALTCGAVPVVTDIPSFRALTYDPARGVRYGALWPPGDAGALAAALADVGRQELAAQRAELAEYAARELSWQAIGRRALSVYQEVLERRRSHAN